MATHSQHNSCRPNGTQSVDLTASTASTALLSSGSLLSEMNVNAVDIFEPMGASPIPTDICLVGLDDDSIDEFDAPLRNTAASSTCPTSFDDAPCKAEVPCDEVDDDINHARAPVDAGAMVTCTGQQHVTHGCDACTKLGPCPICLKAASDEIQLVIPEGHGCLRCRSADGQGHWDVHVHHHPSINGTPLSPTSLIKSARKSNCNFTGQTTHQWFSELSLPTGNMSVICHHGCSKA